MRAADALVMSVVVLSALAACSSGDAVPPEVKDNGTCTFSGAITGTHTCTVAGAFTTGERVGIIEISYNLAAGYADGGVVGDTLYGTIGFPAAPVPGTYTGTSASVVPGYTQITLANVSNSTERWATTAVGSFSLVLTTVSLLGNDPEIGAIYRPTGSLDATLVPAGAGTTGNVTLHATF